MIIQLNGIKETIDNNLTIYDLIKLFKEGDPDLIVEMNNKYIPSKNFATTYIIENSIIEFINPNLGG
jgi:thiamine biosynthesis protein ThiS